MTGIYSSTGLNGWGNKQWDRNWDNQGQREGDHARAREQHTDAFNEELSRAFKEAPESEQTHPFDEAAARRAANGW